MKIINTIRTNLPNSSTENEKNLHKQFVKLGMDRRRLTNELLALLPEIYARGIYKKYSATIVEYAGKFGGLSKNVVMKRLRLEKYLIDKPQLKELIKTEGVHKVAIVANLATSEDESLWVDKLKNMSKNAIQELSKEVRSKRERAEKLAEGRGFGGLFGEEFCEKSNCKSAEAKTDFCRAVAIKITLELDEEMTFQFLKLKKMMGKNLSNKQVMNEMLTRFTKDYVIRKGNLEKLKSEKDKENTGKGTIDRKNSEKVRIEPILEDRFQGKIYKKEADEKERICEKAKNPKLSLKEAPKVRTKPILEDCFQEKNHKKEDKNSITRYIQVLIRKMALQSTNDHCAYPGCNRPPETFHHPERFGEGKNHNSLIPLCKIHHEFMHNGLIENEALKRENWRLFLDGKIGYADFFYRMKRR